MMNEKSKRCSKCLLPDSYPGIEFDDENVCNFCRDFKKKELLGEQALLNILTTRKGIEYDCVLGISGGKDSCYVAYLTKKKYNLRALAVCYDFPFLCDLARDNIRQVCKSLDLDLLVVKSKDNIEYGMLRNHLLSTGSTGTFWGQCIFCHYGIEAILYNVAKEKSIPWILSGVTKYELWNLGSRTKFLLNRVKQLPFADKLKFLNYQAKTYYYLVQQRRQFPIPGNSNFNVYKRAVTPSDTIRGINVFEYERWDQQDIERILIEETGWVKPQKSISWRYDCSLEPLLDITYKKEFGISTAGIYLSNLIRDEIISREDALVILEKSENEAFLNDKLKDVSSFLNIPH
jgi:hypothetical protein